MEALKFELSARHAFFKNPEVNSIFYATYGQIHKVALLGMFGAVLGYSGYPRIGKLEGSNGTDKQNQWLEKNAPDFYKKLQPDREYPEFYEKLKSLKIAIVPKGERTKFEPFNGCFKKKIQKFNNANGYGSQEAGGTLIVSEQWLENPCWEIYVLLDQSKAQELAQSILKSKCVYLPYLGKNDHPADIRHAQTISLKPSGKRSELKCISLIPRKGVCLKQDSKSMDNEFTYTEYLPVALDRALHLHVKQKMIFSNQLFTFSDQAICDPYELEQDSDGNQCCIAFF